MRRHNCGGMSKEVKHAKEGSHAPSPDQSLCRRAKALSRENASRFSWKKQNGAAASQEEKGRSYRITPERQADTSYVNTWGDVRV